MTAPPSREGEGASASAAGDSWYLQRGNSRAIGPFSTADIVEGIAAGEIPRQTLVCAVDGKQWIPLDGVAAFADALAAREVPRRSTGREAYEATALSIEAPELPKTRRIVRRPRAVASASPAAVNVATLIASLLAALSLLRMLVVFLPTPALARLLDAVRPLRSELVTGGALGTVAWMCALFATRAVHRREAHAADLARASALAWGASTIATTVALVRVARGTFARVDQVAQARGILWVLLASGAIAAIAWAALLYREIGRAPFGFRAPVAVAAAASALTIAAWGLARVTDLVRVDGAVPVPAFTDEGAVRRYVEAVRAGASGTAALDDALSSALFLKPGTRARFVDEQELDVRGGPFVARRLRLLDGDRVVLVPR